MFNLLAGSTLLVPDFVDRIRCLRLHATGFTQESFFSIATRVLIPHSFSNITVIREIIRKIDLSSSLTWSILRIFDNTLPEYFPSNGSVLSDPSIEIVLTKTARAMNPKEIRNLIDSKMETMRKSIIAELRGGVSVPCPSITMGSPTSPMAPNTIFTMNRKLISVSRAYLEWHKGLDGGPSVLEIVAKYGSTWRTCPDDDTLFNRRRAMIHIIDKYANENNVCPQWLAREIERVRKEYGYALDDVQRMLGGPNHGHFMKPIFY